MRVLPGDPAASPGRRGGLRARLLGPRFVDPPIRLVGLVFAVFMILPLPGDDMGLTASLLQDGAALLLLLATFRPGLALVLTIPGEVLHLVLQGEHLTPFFASLVSVLAVAAAGRRWRLLLLSVLAVFLEALAGGLVAGDGHLLPGVTEVALCLLALLLGLSAALLQTRLDVEIRRREQAARGAERELQRLRVDLAADTHDTVSHALATESAIIRMMGRSREQGVDERVIAELALVNARAQRQLRQLLARLRSVDGDGALVDLSHEVPASLEAIRSGARAGGFDLETRHSALPTRVDARMAGEVQLVLFELATNVLKHACSTAGARVEADGATGEGGDAIVLRSRNRVRADEPVVPRTLTRRAEALGGSCTAAAVARGVLEVSVVLPLPLADLLRPGEDGHGVGGVE